MYELVPIPPPPFSLTTYLFSSGIPVSLGWISLCMLSVLALLMKFRLVPVSIRVFCELAHLQGLFFLLTVGIYGFINSTAILCGGLPPFDSLMLSLGQVLFGLAAGLILVTGLVIMVRRGSEEMPNRMPRAWLQVSLLVADVTLILAMQMTVFSFLE